MTDYEKDKWITTISAATPEELKVVIEELEKKGYEVTKK